MQYQLFPALSTDEYDALKADIARRGVMVAVEYDEAGNILDGHHRVQVCKELGLSEWPRVVRRGFSEDEKTEHVLALNLDRRHLTREQRQEIVGKLRGQGWSTRRIAQHTGIPRSTVSDYVQEVSEPGHLADTITGSDGKCYPAMRASAQDDYSTRPAHYAPPMFEDGEGLEDEAEPDTEPAPNKMAVHFSSDSVEWYTPPEIVERAMLLLGVIDLDPCSNSHEAPRIPAKAHFTKEDDGLSREWRGRVYMNPPYGREIADWVAHLKREYEAGRVTEALALVPSRTDTEWFRSLREYARCFIWGRLRFSEQENTAPFPSMAVYLGGDVEAFKRAFGDMGDVYRVA